MFLAHTIRYSDRMMIFSSLLADVDFDAWDDDDSFCNDAAESDADPGGGSEAKRLKTS